MTQRRLPMQFMQQQMQLSQQMPQQPPMQMTKAGYPALNSAQVDQLRELLAAQELDSSTGSVSGAPSTLMSSRGKAGAAALTAANLIEPRVAHLEEKTKEIVDRLSATVSDQDAKFGFVIGTTLLETIEFVSTDADPHVATRSSTPTPVPAGIELSLSYPQAAVVIEGERKIVMRRRIVDPDSAQLTFSWIVVYAPDDNEDLDIAFVGAFRV